MRLKLLACAAIVLLGGLTGCAAHNLRKGGDVCNSCQCGGCQSCQGHGGRLGASKASGVYRHAGFGYDPNAACQNGQCGPGGMPGGPGMHGGHLAGMGGAGGMGGMAGGAYGGGGPGGYRGAGPLQGVHPWNDGAPSGPPGAQVGYPYYTLRGPRDFLLNNPPSIGP